MFFSLLDDHRLYFLAGVACGWVRAPTFLELVWIRHGTIKRTSAERKSWLGWNVSIFVYICKYTIIDTFVCPVSLVPYGCTAITFGQEFRLRKTELGWIPLNLFISYISDIHKIPSRTYR